MLDPVIKQFLHRYDSLILSKVFKLGQNNCCKHLLSRKEKPRRALLKAPNFLETFVNFPVKLQFS